MIVTAAKLKPAIASHADLVDLALGTLFPEPTAPINLDGLEAAAGPGEDTADILLAVLNQRQRLQNFISFLRSRGVELFPRASAEDIWDEGIDRFNAADFDEPDGADFAFEDLNKFTSRAKAFRCRILVNGAPKGSGAFVSPRLVMTAAHVISEITDSLAAASNGNAGDVPRLSIKASDGKEYSARYAFHLPVHSDEHEGHLPPAAVAKTHCDVALLRVMMPLGQSYGRVALPDQAPDWIGTRRFALVHYPNGEERGFCPGVVRRTSADELRLPHDIDTLGGSSGGPGFDDNFDFLGLHQGRMQSVRRLVPFSLFAANQDFRQVIRSDQPPRYLWSLDGDIDGPIIIGRRTFFTGLAAMLDHPDSRLRGVWVRRLRRELTTGLSFSFEMLKAFLARQEASDDPQPRHLCFRVPTALGLDDLISPLAQYVLGKKGAEAARPGVREGETSLVAQERDRAAALASELDRVARERGQTFWFFFEEPPGGELSASALVQFEHFVEWLVTHKNLRVVLAGFEQYALAPLRFQRAEEGLAALHPGLLVDQLGTFSRQDLRVTLREALRDLNNEAELDQAVLEDMAAEITQGMDEVRAGAFDIADLDRAIQRTRTRLKFRLGIDDAG